MSIDNDPENENFEEVIDLIQKSMVNEGECCLKNRYVFPRLKAHSTIEKLKEEELQRQRELERQAREKERYEKERKNLEGEDQNAFVSEPDADKSKSDSFSDY